MEPLLKKIRVKVVVESLPNTIVYNCVLNGLAQSGMAEEGRGNPQRDEITFADGSLCS
jgi:hypothetical protein